MCINNNRLYAYTKFRYSFNRGFPVKSPSLFGDFAKIHISMYPNAWGYFIQAFRHRKHHLEIYHPQQCCKTVHFKINTATCKDVIQNRKGIDKIIRFDKAWKNACQDDGIGIMEYLSLAPVAQWIEQWIPKPYPTNPISYVFLSS